MITARLANDLSVPFKYIDALGRSMSMTLQRPAGTQVKVVALNFKIAEYHRAMIEFECGKCVEVNLDKLMEAVLIKDKRIKNKLNYRKINVARRLELNLVNEINKLKLTSPPDQDKELERVALYGRKAGKFQVVTE
jgi:hypothetical protein